MKPLLRLTATCAGAALLAACAGAANAPSNTAPAEFAANTGAATYLYASDVDSNTVSAFEVNNVTGALTSVAGSPFPTLKFPWGVAVIPGKFLYVANGVGTNQHDRSPNYVSGYTIDAGDGVLSTMPGSPFRDPSHGAADMAVSVSHKYAYVVNIYSGNVAGYAIKGDGKLSVISGSPFRTGAEPETLGMDPLGKFVYVGNTESNNVSAFKIDDSTGALIPVKGSPFPTQRTPAGVAVDFTGSFLYVTNGNSNSISAYVIDRTTGALQNVNGSPFPTNTPSRIVADPKAGFVYVTNNGSATVSAFSIDAGSGALTPVRGSPFVTGSGPSPLAIDPTGSFLYVGTTRGIFGYSIGSVRGAGASNKPLTLVAGSPFAAGTDMREMTAGQ